MGEGQEWVGYLRALEGVVERRRGEGVERVRAVKRIQRFLRGRIRDWYEVVGRVLVV